MNREKNTIKSPFQPKRCRNLPSKDVVNYILVYHGSSIKVVHHKSHFIVDATLFYYFLKHLKNMNTQWDVIGHITKIFFLV